MVMAWVFLGEISATQLSELPSTVTSVIIDIGANTDPILPRRGDRTTMTLAFEPIVHDQIEPSRQLMVVPAAVAATDELRTMRLYHRGMVSSSLSRISTDMPRVGTRAVPVLALRTVLHAIPYNVSIALMKTDIQGHDFEALSSVESSLLWRAPYLKTEVFLHGHSEYLGVRNDFCDDFVPHLTQRGYRLVALVGLETKRATIRGNDQAAKFCAQYGDRQHKTLPGALAFEADAYWKLEGSRQPAPTVGWIGQDAFPQRPGPKVSLPRREAAHMWMTHARSGHCGATNEGDEGDCALGQRGSWPLDLSSTTWVSAVQECLARCGACQRCKFVSLSLHLRDCSWYQSCELNNVLPGPAGHMLMSGRRPSTSPAPHPCCPSQLSWLCLV